MGMINCKECDKQISDEAKACPHCGAPAPKSVSLGGAIVIVVFAVFFVGMCSQSSTDTKQATPKTPAEIQREKDFQKAVAGLKYLRDKSKNPASFEVVDVLMINSDTLCIQYRGRNSFNAVVPGHYVFTDKVSSSEAKDWNRHCANKTGTDFTSAKHAL